MDRSIKAILWVCVGCALGCKPSLEGDWSGTFDCSDPSYSMELDVTLPLADVGDGEFAGDFEAEGTMSGYGLESAMQVSGSVQLELSTDKIEAQDITARWSDCEIWMDGAGTQEDCDVGDDWEWDGADELSYADEDCEMVLTRSE